MHSSDEHDLKSDSNDTANSTPVSPDASHAIPLLCTNIGEVVGGVEAANRFKDLVAKTLRTDK